MNIIRTYRNKRKYPWLYRREDLYSDITFEELHGEQDKQYAETLIGTWLNDDYFIIDFIGRGTFSFVYLTYNYLHLVFQVVKMILPCYFKEGKYEEKINKILCESNPKHFNYITNTFIWKKNPKIRCFSFNTLGISLEELHNRAHYKRLTDKHIIKIFRDILINMKYIHQCHLIHTDLKLDNILTTIYTKKHTHLITFFKNLNCHAWINELSTSIYNSYNHNSFFTRNTIEKCIYASKLQFSSYYLRQRKIFDEKLNNEKLTILETIPEIDEFDNIRAEDLEDINPGNNIQIPEPSNMNAYVIDFGNCVKESSNEKNDITFENYRAPENIINYDVTQKGDVWTLGCIFYELLCGKMLFTGTFEDISLKTLEIIDENLILTDIKQTCHSNQNKQIEHFLLKLKKQTCIKMDEQLTKNMAYLLSNMLCIDVGKRWDIKQCLEYSIFKT